MTKLEEILKKESAKATDNAQNLVQEAKLLLEQNGQEERTLLRSIGLDAEISFTESIREDLVLRKGLTEKLGFEVLHESDISKFCLDYRLYMRPAREFNGGIPPELGAELVRFCKEKSIPIGASSSHSDFFIIAPPKMFKGYLHPGQVFEKALSDHFERQEQERLRKQADPILVYRTLTPGYFAVIKSWGKDEFTPLRKVYGYLTKRQNLSKILNTISFFLVATAFLLTPYLGYISTKTVFYRYGEGWAILAGLVSLATLVVAWAFVFAGAQERSNFKRDILSTVTEKQRFDR